jgi:hypothetical protein
MGIRELAAEAKKAELAHEKAEKQRLWHLNARRGEETVMSLLGVPGKATRAYNGTERDFGEGTVVKLEDDLYVKVGCKILWSDRSPYSRSVEIGREPNLTLVGEDGYQRSGSYNAFTTLAALGDELARAEKREAENAAIAANKAKISA